MNPEGSVAEIEVLPALLELGQENFTGAIRFEHDDIIKIIYFKQGDVLSASTNDRTDSIDEILLRSGKVSREHLRQALGRRKETESLGDALLVLGFITKRELTWARRAQLVGILRSLQKWADGIYTIVPEYLPKREEGTIFYLPQIAIEVLVTDSDRAAVDQALHGGEAVLRLRDDSDEAYRLLGLNEEADQILARVDGQRTARELAELSGKDAFTVYKLLNALRILKIVEVDAAGESIGSNEAHSDEPAFAPAVDEEPEAVFPVEAEVLDLEMLPPLDSYNSDESTAEEADAAAVAAAESSVSVPPPVTLPEAAAAPGRERSRRPVITLWIVALLIIAAALAGAYVLTRQRFPARLKPATTGQTAAVPAQRQAAVRAPLARTMAAEEPRPVVVEETTAPQVSVPPAAVAVSEDPAPAVVLPESQAARTNEGRLPTVAGADEVRARYDAMAADFARNATERPYTVQFELVCETASITKALGAGGERVWFVPTRFRGRSCYRVFWGRYDDRAAAAAAVAAIPDELGGGRGAAVLRTEEVNR